METSGLIDTDQTLIAPEVPVRTGIYALGVERHPSLSRKFVEFMLYASIILSQFPTLTGLHQVRFGLGGMVFLAGIISLLIALAQREGLPGSVWFYLAINVAANLSQFIVNKEIPLIGEGLNFLAHTFSYLVMMCFLVQNSAAEKRIIVFFGAVVTVAVATGGVEGTIAAAAGPEAGRLALEEMGGAFANANTLAYVAGLFSVAGLFWSLRSRKIIRPFIWLMSAMLAVIMVRTISRGGIATYVCGCLVLLAAVLLGRGVRLSGIILIAVAVIAFSQFAYMLSRQFYQLQERAYGRSEESRLAVYSKETVYDLWNTKIFGRGPSQAKATAAGISPHNSFIYAHLAFGGPTAWIYLLWLLYLAVRIFKMFMARDIPMDIKMQVLALFGMAVASQLLSNKAHQYVSCIFAVAVIEKYTSIYSKRHLRKLVAAQQHSYPPGYE